jgi:uncharacterized protein (UPF0335 family)
MAGKYPEKVGGNAAGHLRSFINRIEQFEEDKVATAADIRDVYAEAKDNGFDPKIMRIVVRRRKMDADERAQQDAQVETYSHTLEGNEAD